jgi:hypothetical protein
LFRTTFLPGLLGWLAGGCTGTIAGGEPVFKMGRDVPYPSRTPIANLFISILNAVGVPAKTFGVDGTAPLSDLV